MKLSLALFERIKTFADPLRPEILRICINRPQQANCLSIDDWRSLQAAFDHLDQTPQYRAGLLYANGRHFCSGIDLKQLDQVRSFKELRDELDLRRPQKALMTLGHGAVMGSGLELFLCGDTRLVRLDQPGRDHDAQLAFSNRKFGIPLLLRSSARTMTQCMALGRTLELILTGRQLSTRQAEQAAIAHETTCSDQVYGQLDRLLLLTNQAVEQDRDHTWDDADRMTSSTAVRLDDRQLAINRHEFERLQLFVHGRDRFRMNAPELS
jgi:enoyl-CoA hydratase/carnithine racemase